VQEVPNRAAKLVCNPWHWRPIKGLVTVTAVTVYSVTKLASGWLTDLDVDNDHAPEAVGARQDCRGGVLRGHKAGRPFQSSLAAGG